MKKETECELIQDLLLGYVDGTLNEKSKDIVERHLAECEKCTQELEIIQKDIKEHANNQKKEIDFLKKIKRKSKIKSILMAIGIILILGLLIFIYKFIQINSMANKSNKLLQENNLYKETIQTSLRDQVAVTKEYYKDGKYKAIYQTYSNNGIDTCFTIYATVNEDKRLLFVENNKVLIEKGENTKLKNKEENLKHIPFIMQMNESLFTKIETAFMMSMDIDTYGVGKEYYILRDLFSNSKNWEIWIDKETGLPIKEIYKDNAKSFFENTDITMEIKDSIIEYNYEFGVVTDQDVDIPDLSKYEIKYIN